MISEVLFKGKTVEQAVLSACQQLEIKEESLNYEVVSSGSTGIFGLVGARKAQIRVFVSEKQVDSSLEPPGPVSESNLAETGDAPEAALSEPARIGREALGKIAAGITPGTSVRTRDEGRRIDYQIEGGKAGVLIGKRGQTLEAIQYLVEKVVNRNSRERVRISIDVGGYLAKKRQNLENLAEKTARKAKKNGKPATIGQLNAHDRRIVHLALKDDIEVLTKSVGHGYLRKLIVMPQKRRTNLKRGPQRPD